MTNGKKNEGQKMKLKPPSKHMAGKGVFDLHFCFIFVFPPAEKWSKKWSENEAKKTMEPVTSPRNRVASHFVRLTANYVGPPPSRPLLVLASSVCISPRSGLCPQSIHYRILQPWYSSASSAPLAIQQRQRHFIHENLPSTIISVGPYEVILNRNFCSQC